MDLRRFADPGRCVDGGGLDSRRVVPPRAAADPRPILVRADLGWYHSHGCDAAGHPLGLPAEDTSGGAEEDAASDGSIQPLILRI